MHGLSTDYEGYSILIRRSRYCASCGRELNWGKSSTQRAVEMRNPVRRPAAEYASCAQELGSRTYFLSTTTSMNVSGFILGRAFAAPAAGGSNSAVGK